MSVKKKDYFLDQMASQLGIKGLLFKILFKISFHRDKIMNKENIGDYFNNLDEEGKTNPKGIKEKLTNLIHKISTLRAKDSIDLKDGRLQENTKTWHVKN